MRIRLTRPGREHRIGLARILAAMRDAGTPTLIGDQLHYLGRDDRGVELEIIAVPDDRHPGGLAVIHAMPTYYRKGKS